MSDSLLLDTDVASYLFKNSPRAKPFRSLLKGKRAALALGFGRRTVQVDVEASLGPAEG